jgi:hypothetical protein
MIRMSKFILLTAISLQITSGIVAVAARYADDASIQSGPLQSDSGSVSYQQYRASSPAHSISSASVESAGESSAYTESQASASHVSSATHSVSGDATMASSYSGTGSYTSYTGTYSSRTTNYTDKDASTVSKSQSDNKTPSSVTEHESSYVNQSTITSVSTQSENVEEKQRINAYRAEVEALVRRVVPDEIDNVDAIMVQFHGREEELIATLRGMQEKTIAQRARAAVQKSAKKEARTGGRPSDEYTASSEDPSSTYDSSASTSRGGTTSMASTAQDEQSITEEFADDSSHSGSESGSSYTSDSDNDTDDPSRSEYSLSASDYSNSQYSRSQYSQSHASAYSDEDEPSKTSRNEDVDSGNWSGAAERGRSGEQGRSSDLD